MAGSRCTVCDHPKANQINKLLAEGKTSERSLAKRFDLNDTSIHRHKIKHLPNQLQRAIERRREREEDKTLQVAIANLEERLKAQDDRWERLKAVIERRAAGMVSEEGIEEAEGTSTGLLVRKVKNVDGELVYEYAVDTGLLKEMRELERQVSQETGQFGESGHGKGSGPVVVIVQPRIDRDPNEVIPEIAVLGQQDEPAGELSAPDEALDAEFEDVPDLDEIPAGETAESETPEEDYF